MKNRIVGAAICLATGFAGKAPLAASADSAVESPISLATQGGSIQGSLVLPRASGQLPVVLIVAGSGPTDRDGNSQGLPGTNDSLKMLAIALAESGFASVRYDKRGIAASAGTMTREADLRFETYVQDAADWARQLADDPRFSRVAIVGHSEGSLIAMLAAQQGRIAALASIAGPGTPAAQLLRQQLSGKLPPALVERNEQILRSLESGTPA